MATAVTPSVTRGDGQWLPSTCGMCLHGCGIQVYVEDGVALKIEGDPTNPDNLGKLCPKGNAGLSRLYDPARVLKPLKRTNPVKRAGVDPGWVEIEWDEAMDIVARELGKIRKDDPRKLLVAIGDFQRILFWGWPAVFGSPNFFTSLGNYCGGSYHPVNGSVDGSFAAINDYERCNYWIQIGSGDGFSSHLHVSGSSKRMADARMRGMKLVVLDPRLSTAAAKADEWIPIVPGTDRAFVLGMAHVLVHELDRYDREFLRQRTNAPYLVGEDGFFVRDEKGRVLVWNERENHSGAWDEVPADCVALLGSFEINGKKVRTGFQVWKDILATHTPEAMSQVCTVPAEAIRRIAREFVDAARIGSTIELEGKTYPFRPAALNYYRGSQSHSNGLFDNMTYKLFNMLVGNIDVPGGHLGVPLDTRGFFVSPGESGQLKPEPHQLHPAPPFKYPPDSTHLMEWFPIGFDAGQLNTETILSPERFGLKYQPEAMMLYHSNPIWNMPETDKVEEIMRRMKFVVAIDIHLTESTQWADIFLPDRTYLESTLLNCLEPPVVTGHSVRQPVVEPLGDTRDAYEILTDLAQRMGFLDNWNDLLNIVCGFAFNTRYLLEPSKRYSVEEIYDRFAHSIYGDDKGLEWFKKQGHTYRPRTAKEAFEPYGNLRIPFYFEFIKQTGAELEKQLKAHGVNDWPLENYLPLPFWKPSQVIEDGKKGYDLYAITFKDVIHTFGDTVVMTWLTEVSEKDPIHQGILINSKTAKKLGVETGEKIRLVSPGGRIEGRAQVVEGIHPQVVGISNSITREYVTNDKVNYKGSHFNRLLTGSLRYTDGATGGLESTARVRLEKVSY
ncbi:MAG: molybdopterin-dependent oxidoreductase [Acidobacteria bacterium]|nr:molybdopterin-dependent oxidoreductase [Acidobacteriota bacterium]